MKKLILIVMIVALVASGTGLALAQNNETGNGAPSGPHYNLNIIGMKHEKTEMVDVEGGHVIFVELFASKSGKMGVETDILLRPAPSLAACIADPEIEGCAAPEDFYVLDKNGTDGEAKFQLPADVATEWTVWVRALGKPGGAADMALCAWDPGTEVWVCGSSELLLRIRGKMTFKDVTNKLLKIGGVNLFDPIYQDYFWKYVGNGLKLAQLRFYPVPD